MANFTLSNQPIEKGLLPGARDEESKASIPPSSHMDRGGGGGSAVDGARGENNVEPGKLKKKKVVEFEERILTPRVGQVTAENMTLLAAGADASTASEEIGTLATSDPNKRPSYFEVGLHLYHSVRILMSFIFSIALGQSII